MHAPESPLAGVPLRAVVSSLDASDPIPPALHDFLVLDLAPLIAVTLAAGALALVGSFLLLRRQAMLGDAMAHSVLPGLVAAFALTGARAAGPMFVGALLAAGVTSAAIGVMTRYGRVEPTTAIGVAFTSMFGLGVVLVETSGARNVDLDLDCVLSGQLELLFWTAPDTWSELLSWRALGSLPGPLQTLLLLFTVCALLLFLGWPAVRCAVFDPGFARSRGIRPQWIRGALLAMTTFVVVACFDALGSILVIALLICPAAGTRLVTQRLGAFVVVSTVAGMGSGALGYFAATRMAPACIGHSVDASGAVAVTAGLWLFAAALTTRVRSWNPFSAAEPTGSAAR